MFDIYTWTSNLDAANLSTVDTTRAHMNSSRISLDSFPTTHASITSLAVANRKMDVRRTELTEKY